MLLEKDDDERGFGDFFLRQFVYSIVSGLVGFLAMPIVFWFSRFREYRADHGGAVLAGKEKMIRALEALKETTQLLKKLVESIQAFKQCKSAPKNLG